MLAPVAATLLLALSACSSSQHVVMNPSEIRPLGATVAGVLDVSMSKLEHCGSALGESPLAAGANRAAKGRVNAVLAGNWPEVKRVEIRFDKDVVTMAPGRYFVMADSQRNWLNWRRIAGDETVKLERAGPALSLDEAAKGIMGKAAPWP